MVNRVLHWYDQDGKIIAKPPDGPVQDDDAFLEELRSVQREPENAMPDTDPTRDKARDVLWKKDTRPPYKPGAEEIV